MRLLRRQIKRPDRGFFSRFLHYVLLLLLPVLVYIAVSLEFSWLAVVIVVISKWRIFSVKSRHWLALFRANAVDIFFALSIISLMSISVASVSARLFWVAIYVIWLLFIRPKSSTIWVGIQALLGQTLAIIAIFIQWTGASTFWLIFAVWSVAYLSARHFLSAFDEQMSRATAYTWAFFAGSVVWVTSHRLIMYGGYIAMPAILLSLLGYGIAAIYYLDHTDKLKNTLRWQFIGIMTLGVLFLIFVSKWSIPTQG